MKQIPCLLLAIGLVQPVFALRITAQPEDAYELSLAEVAFPITAPGALGLANCGDCRHASLMLMASTSFFVESRSVQYDELLSSARQLRLDGEDTQRMTVFVFFDIATGNVNRLRLKISSVN